MTDNLSRADEQAAPLILAEMLSPEWLTAVLIMPVLGSRGIDAPGWDKALTAYRRGLVYGYYLWAITRLVDVEITTEFVSRLGLAAAANDSFAAVTR